MLSFNPDRISRTTTKAQWREIDRWRRTVQKKLKAEMDQRRDNLVFFGTTHPELAEKQL